MKKILIALVLIGASAGVASATTLDDIRACFDATTTPCLAYDFAPPANPNGRIDIADMSYFKAYMMEKPVAKTSAPASTPGSKSGSRALTIEQMCERGLFDGSVCTPEIKKVVLMKQLVVAMQELVAKLIEAKQV